MNLIFDMDGTLADTARATVPAFAALCSDIGWPAPSECDIRAAIGTPNPEFYYRLFPDRPRADVFELGQRIESAEEHWVREIGPSLLFPGVHEMLEELNALGVPMYIASTGDTAHVDAVLGSAGIRHLFRSVHCHEPEKADMVARIIDGSDPRDWALLGDRDKDIRAARANAIAALGAGFGYCPREEWPLYDAVFTAPSDLTAWVKAQIPLD